MKACPVVLRFTDTLQILAFEHPLAGLQLVKGSVEPGETPADAAVRELFEESGLVASGQPVDLGRWFCGYHQQDWSFHLCPLPAATPDTWIHSCADDGGHDFRFFWHPLRAPAGERWHPMYQGALTYLSATLGRMIRV